MKENRSSEQKEKTNVKEKSLGFLCSGFIQAAVWVKSLLYKPNSGPCPMNLQLESGSGRN